MSFLMPDPPKPKDPPPAPTRTDAEVQAMAASQRQKYAGYGGRSTTSLTGGMALGSGERGKATLLGGGSL